MREILKISFCALGFVALLELPSFATEVAAKPPLPPSAAAPSGVTPAIQRPPLNEDEFVPIEPCKLFNTATSKKIAAGTKRRFYVSADAATIKHQGGSDCNIPEHAAAVHLSLTASGSPTNGYLKVFASDSTEPAVRSMSFLAGGPITSEFTTRIGADGKIAITATGGTVHVIGAVDGYYIPQMHGMIAPGGVIFSGTNRIVGAANPSDGVYVVTFDTPITYCTPVVTPYNAGAGVYGAGYAFSGNTATVFTWYLDSTTHKEKLLSYYFYITIRC
jgi:hypothetical protein